MITNVLKAKKGILSLGLSVLLLAPAFTFAQDIAPTSAASNVSDAAAQQNTQTTNTSATNSGTNGTSAATPQTTSTNNSSGSSVVGSIGNGAVGLTGAIVKGALDVIGLPVEGIAYLILFLAGIILSVVGTLFNWVIVYTVFNFGAYFGNSTGLLLGWGVLRDIGNIALLFAFVYLGIMVILDVHGYEAQKTLPRLIIVAVLLNFSLFAAEAIIDFSNVLSASIFANAAQSAAVCGTGQACTPVGIADQIIQTAGIGSLWSDGPGLKELLTDAPHTAITFIGLSLFVSITAVVLLAAAILFIIRAISLVLVMVTAPVAFVAVVLPQSKNLWDQWLSTLLKQSFFAPIYLLLVYIGLKITQGLTTSLNGAGNTSLFAAIMHAGGNAQSYGIILIVFALVIGFMAAALIVAKNMGAMGASFATNTASRAVYGTLTRGTNFIVGNAGMGARKLIQRTAGDTFVGSALNSVIAKPLEKTNFDLRRAGAGAIVKAGGATDGANAASHALAGDLKHVPQHVRDSFRQNRKEYSDQIKLANLEDEAHHLGGDQQLSAENQRTLSSLNTKQLESLHGIQDAVEGMAKSLSPQQFEDLMKSDKLSDVTKDRLRTGRFNNLKQAVEGANKTDEVARRPGATDAEKKTAENAAASARKLIEGLADKDIEQLAQSSTHSDLFEKTLFGMSLTDDQASKVSGNQRILKTQKDALQAERAKRFNEEFAAATLANMSADAIVKLPGGTLKQAHVIAALSPRQLSKLDPSKIGDRDAMEMTETLKISSSIPDDHRRKLYAVLGTPATATTPYIPGSDPQASKLWKPYLSPDA